MRHIIFIVFLLILNAGLFAQTRWYRLESVEGIHPSDWGRAVYAKAYMRKLREIMSGSGLSAKIREGQITSREVK